MQFGFNFANFGYLGDVALLAQLAGEAEAAGWDAVFLWDHVNWPDMGVHADPWIALGVIAAQTERIRIGTAVTPIARRRPSKLAREIATLDALSNGRFIFGAGNGLWPDEFDALGDQPELKVRAEMLEEGLDLLTRLWTDAPVDFNGRHYQVKTQGFGTTIATPRVPIWLGATWPHWKPIRRAAQWDGIIPIHEQFDQPVTPDMIRQIAEVIAAHRDSDDPFDIACGLRTGDDAQADAARAIEYADAGATWWLDSAFPAMESLESVQSRIRRGPPRG